MTQEELEKLCAYWQGVLRLQDWDVRVKLVRRMELDGRLGWCRVCPERGAATIHVMDPIDDDPNSPEDPEDTLVHELLHISTHGMNVKADTPEGVAEERHINTLAGALVKLNRKGAA